MIEIINEPEDKQKKLPRLPREVRQIGNMRGYGTIYMEDYIYRFLHQEQNKLEDVTCILLGEDYYHQENDIFFIRGAFCISSISYAGGFPVFSDDVWDEIFAKVRRYFPEQKILGWSHNRPGRGLAYEEQMERICRRHFAGEHRLVLLLDNEEEEETFYVSHQGKLLQSEGYYVYVERNGAMQDYLTDFHIDVQEREEQKRSSQKIIATSTRDVGQETVARYRELLQEQDRKKGQGITRMVAPVAALVLLVLSAVLVQNYMKLHDMEQDVETLARERAKEEVLATISQGVEKEEQDEQQEQDTPVSEAPENTDTVDTATSINPYQAQGYYIVEQGDRLTSISRKVYGNEDMVSAICEKNGITNMDHICPGDKLLLP